MTAFEMKSLISEFVRSFAEPVLNLMFHSMEVIPRKTPFVRTKLGQALYLARLQKVLRYLQALDFRSETLEAIYDQKLRQIRRNNC